MHERYLEITYHRGRPMAAYLYLPRSPDEKSQRVIREGHGLIVDIAEGDRLIGIEIVSPNDVSLAMLNEVLAKYSLPLLERGELARWWLWPNGNLPVPQHPVHRRPVTQLETFDLAVGRLRQRLDKDHRPGILVRRRCSASRSPGFARANSGEEGCPSFSTT